MKDEKDLKDLKDQTEPEDQKDKKGSRKKVLFTVCILVCILCVAYIASYYIKKNRKQDEYKVVQKKVEKEIEKAEVEEEPKEVIPIDFASLKQTNEEIYAWITIPDTNINYPVLQSGVSNAYYLDHAFDGNEGIMGAIFTENFNTMDFSDYLTVLYGHIMKDNTMFTDLHKFEDPEFFNTHDTFTIYTETEKKTYKIFAAVEYDNRHIMFTYNKDNPDDRKAFLESLRESRNLKNNYRDDVEINENSKIVALSTCVRWKPDKRFVVGAVEIDE